MAYGHEGFKKSLDQWIASSGHRKNLLLPKASRVGVASARSATSRTYWAMVIAGDYEKPRPASDKQTKPKTEKRTPAQSCRMNRSADWPTLRWDLSETMRSPRIG